MFNVTCPSKNLFWKYIHVFSGEVVAEKPPLERE
jgi:hypothetical protein